MNQILSLTIVILVLPKFDVAAGMVVPSTDVEDDVEHSDCCCCEGLVEEEEE